MARRPASVAPPPRPARRGSVWAEALAIILVLSGLVGTLALLVRTLDQPPPPRPAPPAPARIVASLPAPAPPSPPPIPEGFIASPLVVDRTDSVVASLSREAEAARAKLGQVETASGVLASALEVARAQLDQTKAGRDDLGRHGELLLGEADRLDAESKLLGQEVDVLERRAKELEQSLQAARSQPGYAILPYKGVNGTWRRPIAVECTAGGATLPPDGPTFSLEELSPLQGQGPGTPFIASIIRLCTYIQTAGAPDGATVIPYVVFVVRPDGIRPFYEARSRVEALGISYGYELVEQDTPVEFPALDDPTIWGDIAALRQQALAGQADRPGLPDSSASHDPSLPLPPPVPGAGEIHSPRTLDELLEAEPSLANALPGVGSGVGSRLGPPAGLEERIRAAQRASTPPVPSAPPTLGAADQLSRPASVGRAGSGLGPAVSRSPGLGTGTGTGNGGPPPANPGQAGQTGLASSASEGIEVPGLPAPPAGLAPPVDLPPPPPGFDAPDFAGLPRALQNLANAGRSVPSNRPAGPPGATGGEPPSPLDLGARPPEDLLKLQVVCTSKGVIVHPGGYKLPAAALKKDPNRLVTLLNSLVESRRRADPGRQLYPQVEFLIEKAGEPLYWPARQSVELQWPDWLVTWKVAEPRPFTLFGQDRW